MFNIKNVTNIYWANPEHTAIVCDVKYAEFEDLHPTGVQENDSMNHIRDLWVKCIAGDFGVIQEYSPPVGEVINPEDMVQPTSSGLNTI